MIRSTDSIDIRRTVGVIRKGSGRFLLYDSHIIALSLSFKSYHLSRTYKVFNYDLQDLCVQVAHRDDILSHHFNPR